MVSGARWHLAPRARRVLLGALAALWLELPGPVAGTQLTETDIKAAFVLNFLRYTQWPASDLGPAGTSLVVAVYDAPDIAERLALVSAGQIVQGRPIEVRLLDADDVPGGGA